MSEDSPADKAVKKSAEGIAPAPPREKIPELTDDDKLYHDIIVAIDEADMLPRDWIRCRMFDYRNRPDVLVNFYLKDENADETLIFDQHVIYAVRVTINDDLFIVERP